MSIARLVSKAAAAARIAVRRGAAHPHRRRRSWSVAHHTVGGTDSSNTAFSASTGFPLSHPSGAFFGSACTQAGMIHWVAHHSQLLGGHRWSAYIGKSAIGLYRAGTEEYRAGRDEYRRPQMARKSADLPSVPRLSVPDLPSVPEGLAQMVLRRAPPPNTRPGNDSPLYLHSGSIRTLLTG